jgi:UDP-3-O-[3-hydroxymyristoyl] glucosamine N-acyltransferase
VPEIKASELAEALGCAFLGEGDVLIKGASSIDKAGEGDLTFFANVKFKQSLRTTAASAIISKEDVGRDDITVIISENPIYTLEYTSGRTCSSEKTPCFILP